jgi:hypothetical protein
MKSVLRILDVYPISQMRIFHPGSRIQGPKDFGSASKNLVIFNLKESNVSKLSEISSGVLIPDPGSGFDF